MKILFLDHGLNLELACLLGRAGHSVAYHVSPVDKHSRHDIHLMGRGFDKEGVEKIDSWVGLSEVVDLIVSPDCYLGETVDWLKARGRPVWGPGFEATKLELDRWYAAQQESRGSLPTAGQQLVVGIPKLMEKLQTTKNVFVKCSGFREIETFKHEDWTATQEQYIAPLLESYGADPELEFVLTQPIDPAVEVGADNIVLNGKVYAVTPYGYENKDLAYVGVLDKVLPEPLAKLNRFALPHLRGCSTFFSSEARVVPHGEGYPIDLTVRAAHPVMAGLMCGINNLPNVITQRVSPVLPQTLNYVAVVVGSSAWAESHPMEVKFPDSIRAWVKLSKAQCRDGRYFTVPSLSYAVQVVGVGHSALEAVNMCKYTAGHVTGKDLNFDLSALDTLLDETIPQGRKYGIDF